jgi:hypothetical protein
MARPRKDAITSDMRRGSDGYGDQKPVDPPKHEDGTRLFLSPHQKQGFKVPVKDENGKPMMQVNPATNRLIIVNGKPIPVLKDCAFKTQSNNVKRGCLSYYETSDTEEIAILEALASDPNNEIMTEENYLKKQDPVKFELQKKVDEQDTVISTQQNVIAELEEKLRRLTGE